MKVPIQDIIIKDRVRTDLGDIKPLMESLKKHGQLNPVTLSRENELIAGYRRTLAAKELGWKYIEACIVDKSTEVDQLQLELEENVHRKDFSPEELLAGYRRLDKLLRPSIAKRVARTISGFFRKLFPWGKNKKSSPQSTDRDQSKKSGDTSRKPDSSNETKPNISSQEIGNYGI